MAVAGCDPSVPWRSLDAPPQGESIEQADPASGALRDASGPDQIGPEASRNVLWVFVYVPYGFMALVSGLFFVAYLRRARAERGFDPTRALRDGHAVVFGTVEAAPEGSGPFVRVEVHQRFDYPKKKRWVEERRAVSLRPFVVVRDDGARVRVEPDLKAVLHDDLSRIEGDTGWLRTRVAELVAGERVYVTGTLSGASHAATHGSGAYRSGALTPVLRPPWLGRMVISTEVPGKTAAKRMRVHRAWLIASVALFVVAFTVVTPTYQLLSYSHRVVWAHPHAVREWREWVKPKNGSGYWVYNYQVRGTYRDDRGVTRVVEADVREDAYTCTTEGRCARLPFVVSPLKPDVYQFGLVPTLHLGSFAALMVLCILSVAVWPVSVLASRPWYARRRVIDPAEGPFLTSKP
jgi:hypothetical protein